MIRLLLASALMMSACTHPKIVGFVLEREGYKDYRIINYQSRLCDWFGDKIKTKVQATNPQGKRVTAAVCCSDAIGCRVIEYGKRTLK